MQQRMPREVGRMAESAVHRQLPVSFRIVSRVVEQGQCMREKAIVQSAVLRLQPLAVKSVFISMRLSVPERLPSAR